MTPNERDILIEKIGKRDKMAMGALTYQGFCIQETLLWLEENGYEIRKKSKLVSVSGGLDLTKGT